MYLHPAASGPLGTRYSRSRRLGGIGFRTIGVAEDNSGLHGGMILACLSASIMGYKPSRGLQVSKLAKDLQSFSKILVFAIAIELSLHGGAGILQEVVER